MVVVLLTGCFVARLAGGRGGGRLHWRSGTYSGKRRRRKTTPGTVLPTEAPGTLTRAGAKDEK